MQNQIKEEVLFAGQFYDHTNYINSLSFSRQKNEDQLILSTGDDDSMYIYRLKTNQFPKKVCQVQKYEQGFNNAQFSNKNQIVVANHVKQNYNMFLFDFEKSALLKNYDDHKQPINSIDVCAIQERCVALCELVSQQSLAVFDNFGYIFATAYKNNNDQNFVKFFDVRNLKGHFQSFDLPSQTNIQKIQFCNDGVFFFVCLKKEKFEWIILDSYKFTREGAFQSLQRSQQDMFIQAAMHPSADYVAMSQGDSYIRFQNQQGVEQKFSQVGGYHDKNKQIRCLEWSRVYNMLASADDSLCLWIPK